MSTVTIGGLGPRAGDIRGCGKPDCDTTRIREVDLFCRSHNALLILRDAPQWQTAAIGFAACVAIWLGFFMTPFLHNIAPLFLVLAAAGGIMVFLPLRMFPVAGRSVLSGWLVACGLAPLLTRSTTATFRVTMTIVVLAVAAAWTVRLARAADGLNRQADSGGGIPGAAAAAALLGLACASLLVWLMIIVPDTGRLLRLPGGAAGWLLMTAAGAAVLAVVGVAGLAAVACSIGRSPQDRLLPEPARPNPLPRPGPNLDSFSRMLLILIALIGEVLIYVCYYRAMKLLVAVANWLILWLDIVVTIAVRSVSLLKHSAWTATKVMAIPAVSMLVAARLLLSFSYVDERYVAGGGWTAMGLLLLFAAAALALLTVTWMVLSALELDQLGSAVVDMLSACAAAVILLLMIGGWGIGLFGTFGHGPIRVGWLTLASTACVVAVSLVLILRPKAAAEGPAGDTGPHTGRHQPSGT